MEVLDNWDGRIHAKLSVPITEETNGWQLMVDFSAPVGKIDVRHINFQLFIYRLNKPVGICV
jgi:hypothetical protein